MLPEDVLLNTRTAFSTSSSTAERLQHRARRSGSEGRYIAPANSENCITVVAGDCAPRTLLIRAPWFARFDIGLSKRFALKGASSIEVSFEMLNVFDNINFNPAREPGHQARRSSASPAPTRTRATRTIRAAASAS